MKVILLLQTFPFCFIALTFYMVKNMWAQKTIRIYLLKYSSIATSSQENPIIKPVLSYPLTSGHLLFSHQVMPSPAYVTEEDTPTRLPLISANFRSFFYVASSDFRRLPFTLKENERTKARRFSSHRGQRGGERLGCGQSFL